MKLPLSNKTLRLIAFVSALLICYAVALASRFAVLHANYQEHDGRVPFTLESALQFRNAQKVYHGEGIPRHDPAIQYPEGIDVFRTDTVWAEYLYGWGARILSSNLLLETRIRILTVAWFSLTVPLLVIWVAAGTRRRSAGVVAGLFYAVSLASVIRSTGLELSRENFALPFLLFHLAWDTLSVRKAEQGGRYQRYAVGSACGLGLALATWDMIQFYTLLWGCVWSWRLMRRPDFSSADKWRCYLPAVALVLVGVSVPYHRAHGLWASPSLGMSYGLLLLGVCVARGWRGSGLKRLLVWVAPLLLMWWLGRTYGSHYHHFVELAWAKIRFLNQKPIDPALLTFNQRIMWVPALNSATWPLTFMFFPGTLIAFSIYGVFVLGFLIWRRRLPLSADACLPVFPWLVVAGVTFIFFVRFHVYVAIWAAAGMGVWWAWPWEQGRRWHAAWIVPLTALVLLMESVQVWEDPGRWGRPNVYYKELEEVTEWLREYVAPQPVLANFGVSASLLAYGGCSIILHPKFETETIRQRVQAYGEALFKQNEEEFRNWAEAHGATHYIHAVGEFASIHPELQMRYFVDALEPPPDAAARVFEFQPERVRYFEYVRGNRKYRVFRLITQADEVRADRLTIRAQRALARGDLDEAERLAWSALALFPAQCRARDVVARVTSLRDQGFTYVPEPEDVSTP